MDLNQLKSWTGEGWKWVKDGVSEAWGKHGDDIKQALYDNRRNISYVVGAVGLSLLGTCMYCNGDGCGETEEVREEVEARYQRLLTPEENSEIIERFDAYTADMNEIIQNISSLRAEIRLSQEIIQRLQAYTESTDGLSRLQNERRISNSQATFLLDYFGQVISFEQQLISLHEAEINNLELDLNEIETDRAQIGHDYVRIRRENLNLQLTSLNSEEMSLIAGVYEEENSADIAPRLLEIRRAQTDINNILEELRVLENEAHVTSNLATRNNNQNAARINLYRYSYNLDESLAEIQVLRLRARHEEGLQIGYIENSLGLDAHINDHM